MAPSSAAEFSPDFTTANSSTALNRVAIALAVLETLIVALFIYARVKIGTANGMDFYLILPSYLVCFLQIILCFDFTDELVFMRSGWLGRHWQIIPPDNQIMFLKLEVAVANLAAATVMLPKLAILALYLRVFPTRRYRWAIFTVTVILVLTFLITFGLNMAMCVPFNFQWNKTLPGGGHCLNQFAIFIWFAIPSIVTDIAIIIIPLPVIWRLKTSRGQKIGLTITFLAGGVGIFTAIIRFSTFLKLRDPLLDLGWSAPNIVMWITIEAGVYLVAACLPSLRILFNPLINDFDFDAVRTRFRGHIHATSGIEIDSLGLRSNAARSLGRKEELQRSRGPHLGLSRSNEPKWPSPVFAYNNIGSQLATCYRERDSEEGSAATDSQTELQGSDNNVILVQKVFVVSREPIM